MPDATGRNTVLWPDFTFRFHELTRRFDAESYALEPGRERPVPAAAQA